MTSRSRRYDMNDIKYMKLALSLAEKGSGFVNPNPMVGAVIVKNGEIIGMGCHEKYGQLHAERNALAACTEPPEGAVMYVTLEPCCHYGKTPPCTEAIIKSGIRKVVVGSQDPNPKVGGKGIKILRENGIEVVTGVLEDECTALNEIFFHYIATQTPFVTMKYAMTMDGKIATYSGKSKWITGGQAREHVHRSRLRHAAIMAGSGTVIADDPMLTCRIPGGRDPVRIICDTRLRIPAESNIVRTADQIMTYIATTCEDQARLKPLTDAGCRILTISEKEGHIDLVELMAKLGEEKIDSILLEGGASLNYSALRAGIVNKVQAYVAPKIFGGRNAKTPVGGAGIEAPDEAFMLRDRKITVLGSDILIEGEVLKDVHRNS